MAEYSEQLRIIKHDEILDNRPIYQLGRVSFTVKTEDVQFEQELIKVLPRCKIAPETIVEIKVENDFRSLVSTVLKLHEQYLWLSAACVLSPQGQKILISGHSSAGKSTTALALAMRYGWKVLSEDLTCLDLQTDRLIVFATPFSLKTGTVNLLKQTIAMVPEPVVFGEWVPLSNTHGEGEYKANFDLSLHFGHAQVGKPLSCLTCKPGKYVRLSLSSSNLVHYDNGPEKLAAYVSSGGCYQVTGGSLAERLDLVLNLTAENVDKSVSTDRVALANHDR